MRFLHTADWQLGKPFAGIGDPQKRALVQQERFQVIRRIGEAAKAHQAEFVLMAGDLFDSSTASKDLLRLELTGSLGVQVASRLEQLIESLQARLLRLKLTNKVVVAPNAEEIQALTQRPSDPLIARVASQLVARAGGSDETAASARIALRELYAACNEN